MSDALEYAPTEKPPFAFCEPAHVTGPAPWCIRPVTKTGLHLGGGVDTASFCERVRPFATADGRPGTNGWDLRVRITEHHLAHACPRCVIEYRKRVTP